MCRTDTQDKLHRGGYLGVLAVLMNLRKVCNHPDLLEQRPVESPFLIEPITFHLPRLLVSILPHHLARGYTGEVWQRLPVTGHAFNLYARCQFTILNLHSIHRGAHTKQAKQVFVKMFEEEKNRYKNQTIKPGYEWLYKRRQTKRISKIQTLYK